VRLGVVHTRRLTAIVVVFLVVGPSGACSSTPGHRVGAPVTSSSSVEPASTAPVSTTTTGPTSGRQFLPVSASFVSARQGWTLEGDTQRCLTSTCNYRVVVTTDGGATWKTQAAPTMTLQNQPRIRFADATHGFVFDKAQVLATQDGGTHWERLQLPFQRVQTLEISHGVVYVVAATSFNNSEGFRIWSTPADHLSWSMDPLHVPLGAGPVPFQQLVFANDAAWLLNVDRTVLSGARRSGDGGWTTWSPPCLDVVGPAELSASRSTDLVALCDEHVWGGTPIEPAVYFSHDGGVTFRRRVAPVYGLFSSPNPTSAVIADGLTVRRTTDEGVTWRVVSRPGLPRGDSAVELGFTTPTQGFLIQGSGGIFITRDAGASWTRAHVP
jgi:photosystem II stability/assembly factor-like uncharacterized protein